MSLARRAGACPRAAPASCAAARCATWLRRLFGACALALLPQAAWCGAGLASSARYCDQPVPWTAEQKDQLFRFGAIIKAALEDSGQGAALVARSGLDLSRFGVRYSHAGVSLKAGTGSAWSVRQLYYACDEGRPRLFDQGLAAFVLGLDDAPAGYVSVVLLPLPEGAAVERAALDNRQALQLLAATYSANAYPFSAIYQNCNQWVAELLAAAWGQSDEAPTVRSQAQRWLQQRGYQPSVFDVGWRPLMWLGRLIPWVHHDDHPSEDLEQNLFRVSMPASIEAFVRATVPGARRIEFCHSQRRVVVHHGWGSIGEGCLPGPYDVVIALD